MNPILSRPYTADERSDKGVGYGQAKGGSLRACAIIPAYNSSGSIAHVVERARRHVDRVVVVDDGCTDETPALARRAGAHVLGGRRNRGKGHALRKGFAYVLSHGFDAAVTPGR